MSDRPQTTHFAVTAPDGTTFYRSSSRLHYTHVVLRCERGAYRAQRWSQTEGNANEAARGFSAPAWVQKRGITFTVVPCMVVPAPEVRRYRATVRGKVYEATSHDPHPYTFVVARFYRQDPKPYLQWWKCDEASARASADDMLRRDAGEHYESIEIAPVTIAARRARAA